MFEHLAAHPTIVVTGPTRSGTTICARMIAADTGYEFHDDQSLARDERAWRAVTSRPGVVAQCPFAFEWIVAEADPGLFVVLMRRPLDEIAASHRRLGWSGHLPWEDRRLTRSRQEPPPGPGERVYAAWDASPHPNALEITYGSLEGHPLWVAPEARSGWHSKQTAAA